jgi:hypothetical protein
MDLEFECPHCKFMFIVNTTEINCGIFRHAVFSNSMMQINPHETKENCEELIRNNLIYGCAKPIRILKTNDDKYIIEMCDYI